MNICQCIKINQKRCSRPASNKSNNNHSFCWQHQKCVKKITELKNKIILPAITWTELKQRYINNEADSKSFDELMNTLIDAGYKPIHLSLKNFADPILLNKYTNNSPELLNILQKINIGEKKIAIQSLNGLSNPQPWPSIQTWSQMLKRYHLKDNSRVITQILQTLNIRNIHTTNFIESITSNDTTEEQVNAILPKYPYGQILSFIIAWQNEENLRLFENGLNISWRPINLNRYVDKTKYIDDWDDIQIVSNDIAVIYAYLQSLKRYETLNNKS